MLPGITASPVGGALPLQISGAPPKATIGAAYSFAPTVLGGVLPYTFSIHSGTLPAGLSLNASTGAITGTATTSATAQAITLRVEDDDGNTADLSATIGVWGVVSVTTFVSAQTTSAAITLPTSLIVAGDIIVVFAITTNGGTLSSSAGWTHTNYPNWGSGDDSAVTWRVATGSDSLSINSTTACYRDCSIFVIRGADTAAGVASASSGGTGSTIPNPPSVNLPGGLGDGVALVCAGQQTQTGRTTGPPSGYTTGVIPTGFDKGGCAYKFLTAVTAEDPPSFTGTAATYNVGLTALARKAA